MRSVLFLFGTESSTRHVTSRQFVKRPMPAKASRSPAAKYQLFDSDDRWRMRYRRSGDLREVCGNLTVFC